MPRKWLWWVWPLWFLLILISFAVLETFGLTYSADGPTLSRFIWTIGQKWPLSIFLWGFVSGGLAVHFFWNWDPSKGDKNG
jgi:hypothetical protein